MAGLIVESLLKLAIAIVLTAIGILIVPALGQFGATTFQSFVVVSFVIFCSLVLLTSSKHKIYHVLSIPFYTQFIQIFQKFDFPGGANSLWRIAPFILSACSLANLCLAWKVELSTNERLGLVLWLVLMALGLVNSPNFEHVGLGGTLIYFLLIPQLYAVLKVATSAFDFAELLDMYAFLLFVILAIATVGLVLFASRYQETDNLLATRNIADTNVTMAYFILLWPFACSYLLKTRFPKLSISILTLLLLTIVMLSFSRGAILIVLPLILLSLFLQGMTSWWTITAIALFTHKEAIFALLEKHDLLYFWSLRFSGFATNQSFWEALQQASGRVEIQAAAWQLFLRKPLLGNGIASFELLGPGFREAHSLLFTILCEQGIMGALLLYTLLFTILKTQISNHKGLSSLIFPLSFVAYLVFSHTVGSVFVILTSKSISVNYIAPMLLLCQYFRADHESKTQRIDLAES